MIPHSVSSPVSLSYIAALRGFAPRQPGASFAYAVAHCRKPSLLTCLAASNPEGRFYGLIADPAACAQAEMQARMQHVDNVFFLHATVGDVLRGKSRFSPDPGLPVRRRKRSALDPDRTAQRFSMLRKGISCPAAYFNTPIAPTATKPVLCVFSCAKSRRK